MDSKNKDIKTNPNVIKAFKDFPQVSTVYVSKKALVYFSPSARKDLIAISRQEVEVANPSINKNKTK